MRHRFKNRLVSAPTEFTAKNVATPAHFPVGTDNSRVMYMYRQNCMMMDRYANYARQLEEAYNDLYQTHLEMKRQFAVLRDYFRHPDEARLEACRTMLTKHKIVDKTVRPESFAKDRPDDYNRYKYYKLAIKGQYYYIEYLKAVLRNNNVDFKKKQSFNTLQFDNLDQLIEQVVNEKD